MAKIINVLIVVNFVMNALAIYLVKNAAIKNFSLDKTEI
jgi:hypothetical protein